MGYSSVFFSMEITILWERKSHQDCVAVVCPFAFPFSEVHPDIAINMRNREMRVGPSASISFESCIVVFVLPGCDKNARPLL